APPPPPSEPTRAKDFDTAEPLKNAPSPDPAAGPTGGDEKARRATGGLDEQGGENKRSEHLVPGSRSPADDALFDKRESDLDLATERDDEAPAFAEAEEDASSTSTKGAGGFAEPQSPAKPKAASPAKKPSMDPMPDPWGDSGGGSEWGERGRSSRRWIAPPPKLRIAQATGASTKNLLLVESLRRSVQADPTRRSSHGALVRAAIRVGHSDALAFAKAWADSDPEHAGALTALADVLAAQGDPIAMRAYASALEVTPFSRSTHDALARAFASKGDLRRACSHRRAIVSIDPSNARHHADLATCLHRSGRASEARRVLGDASGRAKTELAALARAESELSGAVAPAAALKGQLRATLSWAGEDDLDIAIVDKAGRRLSAMHPSKLVVREGAGIEQLAMAKVKGSVFVEITRVGSAGGERLPPIRGNLELRTPGGNKSFPIIVDGGSTRVAKVFWSI
ncbi:MAG: hypothetical protein IAG13_21535, partial [Deltaproteobacteria bacterium]|nr:hypothetical protein [Nannocystaceae bacterium]